MHLDTSSVVNKSVRYSNVGVMVVVYALTNITSKHLSTRILKTNIGLYVQLKVIPGNRVTYHGCNLTKMFTVYVILQKHTLKHYTILKNKMMQ